MRLQRRTWLIFGPLAWWMSNQARAQANSTGPSSPPAAEQSGAVQVGAGTQGDVTTGASGGSHRKKQERRDGQAAQRHAQEGQQRRPAAPAAGSDRSGR